MFPDVTFLGLDLYTLLILVGVLAAIIVLRVFSDKTKMPAKLFNFVLLCSVLTVVVGYASAVLFQMFYHYQATGRWEVEGATFYGGLIGGAVFFLAFYFGVGHFVFKDKIHLVGLTNVVNCAITCVVLAHAFGRLGCLCAGCCYGVPCEGFPGITEYIHGEWVSVVPTQLFEAIFLFLLFGFLTYMLLKKKNEYVMSMYLVGYGVWRFIIEYWRGDAERGESLVSWLSPSQFTAIFMVLGGVVLAIVYKFWLKAKLDGCRVVAPLAKNNDEHVVDDKMAKSDDEK